LRYHFAGKERDTESGNDYFTVQDFVMGTWTFQYDALNRLLSGAATTGTYSGKNACWSYDDFGNRTIESVQASACSNAGNFASTLVFNANNQLSGVIPLGGGSQSPPTLLYDAAGDVAQDLVTSNQYVYDAEGRICAFSTPNGMGGSIVVGYLYDANGTRVAKGTIHSVLVNGVATLSCDLTQNGFTLTESYVLGPGGEELTMLDGSGAWQRTNVFGGSGQLATYDIAANPAHTSTNGLPATAPALHFQLTDPLGTRRMQTNADGQPETDIQSLPFGDGLAPSTDQYAPATADDATPLHFTGKERDAESGNDYFEARYYSSAMGRFLSPDWSAKVEPVPYSKLDDPQSLNLYAYVQNNPLIRVDVDGHDFVILNDSQVVHGNGHNASIVGNDKSGWTYYSKDGPASTTDGNQRKTFSTFSDFQKSDTSGRYDRGARVETSGKQDEKMKAAGDKNFNKDYSLAATHNKDGSTKAENCADLTATIGQAGGVKIDKPDSTPTVLRSSFSVDLPATNPNKQFGGVILNNNATAVQPHIEQKKPQ
jgi:RHS repeat-associated protein